MKLSGVVLTPAYGRDYASREEVVQALNEGKDFRAHHYGGSSGYCGLSDLADGEVGVRIQKLEQKVYVTVKDGVAS